MQPHDECSAVTKAVDDMHLPQRLAVIQRRAHQGANQLLQRPLVVGVGQADAVQVGVNVEVGIVFPIVRGKGQRRPHHALPEAVELQQPALDQRPKIGHIDWSRKGQHPRDHHQIGRVFHLEPGGIDVG